MRQYFRRFLVALKINRCPIGSDPKLEELQQIRSLLEKIYDK